MMMPAPVETGNSSMGIVPSRQQHHETIRSSLSLRHAGQRHHQTHLVAPPVPRHSNGSSSSNSSVAAAARVNHRSLPPPHLEMGHRHAGAPPATGIRIYRPHRGSDQSSAPRNHHSNHQHLAQLRYLQADVCYSSLSLSLCCEAETYFLPFFYLFRRWLYSRFPIIMR